MVEGGRIDHAHHAGNAARALEDTVAFDQAVKTALDMTKRDDTLIIVTADHSHTMSIQGYPKRNNPILGLAIGTDGKPQLGGDGKPYTTLDLRQRSGRRVPGAPEGRRARSRRVVRADLTGVDTTGIDFLQQSTVPMASETHGGDDVAIFAWGPWAHLFQGVVEENFTYHVMSHASGLK